MESGPLFGAIFLSIICFFLSLIKNTTELIQYNLLCDNTLYLVTANVFINNTYLCVVRAAVALYTQYPLRLHYPPHCHSELWRDVGSTAVREDRFTAIFIKWWKKKFYVKVKSTEGQRKSSFRPAPADVDQSDPRRPSYAIARHSVAQLRADPIHSRRRRCCRCHRFVWTVGAHLLSPYAVRRHSEYLYYCFTIVPMYLMFVARLSRLLYLSFLMHRLLTTIITTHRQLLPPNTSGAYSVAGCCCETTENFVLGVALKFAMSLPLPSLTNYGGKIV